VPVTDIFTRIKRRFFRSVLPARPGEVDFREYPDKTAFYRRLGTSTGERVRLLGHIDGVNPQFSSIGDYSVIGANSVRLAHCPEKGAKPCRVGRFVYVSCGAIILPGVTSNTRCWKVNYSVGNRKQQPESHRRELFVRT
jgi:hypothetical protein